MPYTLPPASSIPGLPPDDIVQILGHLFEPAPALVELVLPDLQRETFRDYPTLIAHIRTKLLSLYSTAISQPPTKESSNTHAMNDLLTILSAHPRLGAKKVDSIHSQSEQSSLGGGPDETQALAQLNREYEDIFPGLRYVTFVNGRLRGEIMEDMRERIGKGRKRVGEGAVDVRDTVWRGEVVDAIEAMCKIAGDRVKKLLATC